MDKQKELANNPIVGVLAITMAMAGLTVVWLLIVGLVSLIFTGDTHVLSLNNFLNGILFALSSHN